MTAKVDLTPEELQLWKDGLGWDRLPGEPTDPLWFLPEKPITPIYAPCPTHCTRGCLCQYCIPAPT